VWLGLCRLSTENQFTYYFCQIWFQTWPWKIWDLMQKYGFKTWQNDVKPFLERLEHDLTQELCITIYYSIPHQTTEHGAANQIHRRAVWSQNIAQYQHKYVLNHTLTSMQDLLHTKETIETLWFWLPFDADEVHRNPRCNNQTPHTYSICHQKQINKFHHLHSVAWDVLIILVWSCGRSISFWAFVKHSAL